MIRCGQAKRPHRRIRKRFTFNFRLFTTVKVKFVRYDTVTIRLQPVDKYEFLSVDKYEFLSAYGKLLEYDTVKRIDESS